MLILDKKILSGLDSNEQSAFQTARLLFTAVLCLILAGDAYFGYLIDGRWFSAVLSLLILGFIHFSVYRLALITVTTQALGKEIGIKPDKKGRFDYTLVSWINSAVFFRTLFVGFISITGALLLALLCFCKDVELIQTKYRHLMELKLSKLEVHNIISSSSRFPFFVIKTFFAHASFKLLFSLFFFALLSPLIYLSRLCRSEKYQYAKLLRESQRKLVLDSFNENLSTTQKEMDLKFKARYDLKSMIIYSDPPFNTNYKITRSKQGTNEELIEYLNSIK